MAIRGTPSQDLRCRAVAKIAAVLIALAIAPSARAQEPTPDPSRWRAVSYADLQHPTAENATYTDIWKDAIEANNHAYRARGDRRFDGANAPAVEAHFVIWSARRSVVLSVLDTATACRSKDASGFAGVTLKLCPLRIAIYDGVLVRTLDGGRACFLENAPQSFRGDPGGVATYVSYDVKSKAVKTGTVVGHQAVADCSLTIPLPPA